MLHVLLHILLRSKNVGEAILALMRRGKTLWLRNRVPARYSRIESRKEVWLSLHTDSESIATMKAGQVWDAQIEAWEARLAGDTEQASERFDAVQKLAQIRGYRYLCAQNVSMLPREELLARIETVEAQRAEPLEAVALLGGVAPPAITVEGALELYWGFSRDKIQGKSEDQIRRWKNPIKKAIRNFMDVVGDRPIAEITGDDMLDFREWWLDRIEAEGLTPNSANKDLIHLGSVLKSVNKLKRLGLVLPLSDLSIKEQAATPRPPFSSRWIKEKVLAPGALDGLNDQARAIFLAMINTGARPSELAALTTGQIHLQANVPYISIEAVNRDLKSANARRIIPLLGVSLEALRCFPDGFSRYVNSSASLSAAINKFLRTNGLLETPEHSFYGLRHSFEDRMLAAGIDERIRRDLMGHALDRERYGKGASLEMSATLLAPISF